MLTHSTWHWSNMAGNATYILEVYITNQSGSREQH